MPTNEHRLHETNLELSHSIPLEVAVGTEIAVKVQVWCPSGCDLRGGSVIVKAAEETVATAELTESEDGRSETSGLTIKVPEDPRRRSQAGRSPDFVSDHAARHQLGRVGQSFARGDGQPFHDQGRSQEFRRM